MKQNIFTALLMLLSTLIFAGDKVAFMEYSVCYSSAVAPQEIENNTDGLFDTAAFDVKAGGTILRWADIYAGASFMFFPKRADAQEHFTFFPLYIGARANIFPEWIVYPDIFAEFGTALCNEHTLYIDYSSMSQKEKDDSWSGSYWNFGIGANWNINDIAILSLTIERPAIKNDRTNSENHFFKTGLAWKIFY